MNVVFLTDAKVELESAVDYYDEQSPELGERFLSCIEDWIRILETFPDIFPLY